MNYIKTVVKEVKEKYVLAELNNIGYQIFIANAHQFEIEKEYLFFLYQEQRLDKNNKIVSNLFGFLEKKQLDFFCFLMQVHGIGSKIAINILNNDIFELFNLIKDNDIAGLSQIKGMNLRLANAIIAESNKSKKNSKLIKDIGETDNKSHIYKEIEETLEEIGYNRSEIDGCISELKKNSEQLNSLDDAINQCIKIIISLKTQEQNWQI